MAPARTDEVLEYLPSPSTHTILTFRIVRNRRSMSNASKAELNFPSTSQSGRRDSGSKTSRSSNFVTQLLGQTRANHTFSHLVSPAKPVTPKMGTILTGVKLETLSREAKDELALLISERKFVICREQGDFLHSGPQFQVDFMSHFGKLSHQPVSGSVKGHPEFHVIHRDGNEDEIKQFFTHKMTATLWHHDVSYERQPPGYVMLGILACPDVGGDTVVADMAEAYKRLSPAFQNMLDQLKAVHTSSKMINHTKAAKGPGSVRADPIDSIHPIIRVHPVTGEKSIFYNSEFPEEVIGLKDMEADVIMKFLMDFICMGHDFQARVHWEKHSVVMFDNRQLLHTGTVDFDTSAQARHLFRLAAMAEVPISVADGLRE